MEMNRMECVICKQRYPKDEEVQSCPVCGAELIDEERESELKELLVEVVSAQVELERKLLEGWINGSDYDPAANDLAREREDIVVELSLSGLKRQDLLSRPADPPGNGELPDDCIHLFGNVDNGTLQCGKCGKTIHTRVTARSWQ